MRTIFQKSFAHSICDPMFVSVPNLQNLFPPITAANIEKSSVNASLPCFLAYIDSDAISAWAAVSAAWTDYHQPSNAVRVKVAG
jgi:hypothetical protein